VECSNLIEKEKLREKAISLMREAVSINNLITAISNYFEVSRKIRIFNFAGLEIMEESDLNRFMEGTEKHKVIFFLRNQETFENKNIMRLFKLKRKLGEVKK
jgi:hypothetical protein